MMKRIVAVVGPILIAIVVAVGYSLLEGSTGKDETSPDTSGPTVASAKEVGDALGKLPVAKEAPMTGYSREEFPHWDNNEPEHGFGPEFAQYERCTTREVMMLRDATGTVTLDPKTCDLKVGKDGGWRDEYGVLDSKTGQLQPYKWITDPKKVDAEHIVPLAEAWRSGAGKLDKNTRRRIANDAVNLVASDPSANRSKGDQDPSKYLPPGNFRCRYVDRYIKIKLKYGLSVDSDEQTALRTAVDECVKRGEFK
ncbi:HNH endonuclease family protein [Nocardia brevicatena]|uniref:HNH endonuclease family protein n=1 Tax=Nocardia brevicatena TaxID=37327 RepID=UPI000313BAA4|nr:HNH endonuclease family protein [Nocardia brevicatena]